MESPIENEWMRRGGPLAIGCPEHVFCSYAPLGYMGGSERIRVIVTYVFDDKIAYACKSLCNSTS